MKNLDKKGDRSFKTYPTTFDNEPKIIQKILNESFESSRIFSLFLIIIL